MEERGLREMGEMVRRNFLYMKNRVNIVVNEYVDVEEREDVIWLLYILLLLVVLDMKEFLS